MAEPVLLVEKRDRIATLTLNRPDRLNALSRELRRAIGDAFEKLAGDPKAAVVILTGAGRAFSAGIDLKEAAAAEPGEAFAGGGMLGSIHRFPKPVIGAINGYAVTGGFELALACDLLVASDEARFADTHARVGILPGWGLSQKLPRLVGIQRAKELSFTGNYIDAATAEAWGLVNRAVPPEELLPTCRALAADMLGCVPEALVGYKRLIDEGYRGTFGDGMTLEAKRSGEHMRAVGPSALAERRQAVQARGREQTAT